MKYYLFASILLISCNTNKQMQLTRDIDSIFSKEEGTFAVAFKNLQSGETLLINEHEKFHAASTMKVPVMVEVFKQAEAGKLSLDDSLELKNEFRSIVDSSPFSLNSEDDSEQKLYLNLGSKRTLRALVYDMIIVSSNLATNLIMELVDAKKVTASMRDIGANDMEVLRGVEDTKAFEKGMNNVTSAFDLMIVFEKLAKRELVSAKASGEMVDILLDQKFNEMIPAQLPKGVKVAHKTGNVSGVRHDAGIVMLPNGDQYVLVLLSKNLKDEEAGIKAMAAVSKLLYDYVVRP